MWLRKGLQPIRSTELSSWDCAGPDGQNTGLPPRLLAPTAGDIVGATVGASLQTTVNVQSQVA